MNVAWFVRATLPSPLRTALLAAVLAVTGQAHAEQGRLAATDLPVVMTAYVDGVVEQQQFLRACGSAQGARWAEGAAMLMASLRHAGLSEADAADLDTRLASGEKDGAAYDCASGVSTKRLKALQAVDWYETNKGMLSSVGMEVVVPGPETDARLAALRTVLARHMPAQARLLNCMVLVDPRWFPVAYADWDKALAEVAAELLASGLTQAEIEGLIAPARSTALMAPVAERQPQIAACIGDTAWMDRYASFEWYTIAGDIREILKGAPQ